MGIRADLKAVAAMAGKAVATRRATREVVRQRRESPPLEPGAYRIAVYFGDGDVNLYQMRQWYKPLQELARTHPVLILSRASTGARALMAESGLPVAFVPTVRSLEAVIATQDIRIVLYVNQNMRNFQMFRYAHRWHVFINHGESDKMYMTTNQFKAYDYALIAGDAARERLTRVLWNYDLDARTIAIGRPQADHYGGTVPYPRDERRVVLYAPTWEGDRPSAHYGSIRTHGEALVAAVLASGSHRLIYRPHPRSGVVDAEYGAAHRRILAAIRRANDADPAASHVYDDGADLGWQLAAADMAVVDISAMVYDRLAAGKPLMVTRPADPAAAVDTHGYLSACEWLDAGDAAAILEHTERLVGDPEAVARLEYWVGHYFGDVAPGRATARFHGAIERLLAEWDIWHDRDTDPVPDTEIEQAEIDEAQIEGAGPDGVSDPPRG